MSREASKNNFSNHLDKKIGGALIDDQLFLYMLNSFRAQYKHVLNKIPKKECYSMSKNNSTFFLNKRDFKKSNNGFQELLGFKILFVQNMKNTLTLESTPMVF